MHKRCIYLNGTLYDKVYRFRGKYDGPRRRVAMWQGSTVSADNHCMVTFSAWPVKTAKCPK